MRVGVSESVCNLHNLGWLIVVVCVESFDQDGWR
ncbi:hypothetical protein HCH_02101 [Hahella chejuensis KCTC 2396]|uniref:Uncharacterized protein n=1 Tax=Hahella chejuensis (strain KCTC 2396) TaxID=349521 RepID=Q2SK94_HAHCH|nr:hypothetical protein HCH_02101 [Hahella chejuensis KCTC 2396]